MKNTEIWQSYGQIGVIFTRRANFRTPSFFDQISKTTNPYCLCSGDPDETIKPSQSINHGFEQLQYISTFSAHVWAWRLQLWKPQKNLTHLVVLTTQLPTRNQNFLNISADTPPPPPRTCCLWDFSLTIWTN